MQSNQKINTEFMLGINEYFDWSEIAKQARMDYLDGKISAEEFIRRIDMYGELKGFTVQKTEQTGESILEKLVKQDLTLIRHGGTSMFRPLTWRSQILCGRS
jgi:hypothetical protein